MNYTSILVTALVALSVVGTGAAVFDEYEDGIQPESKEAKAFQEYCHERFGEDADVYVANVMFGHGGYHCDAGDQLVHMHAIPDNYLRAYANGSMTEAELTERIEDR